MCWVGLCQESESHSVTVGDRVLEPEGTSFSPLNREEGRAGHLSLPPSRAPPQGQPQAAASPEPPADFLSSVVSGEALPEKLFAIASIAVVLEV